MSVLDEIRKSVIDGELNTTQEKVQQALAEKVLHGRSKSEPFPPISALRPTRNASE